MELPSILPESSFHPEHNTKHSMLLQDAQITQEANDNLSLLLEGDYNSIISKSPMDVGRTNIFQIDNPTVELPTAHKKYPTLLKYQEFVDGEIRYLENAGCISKSLCPCTTPVIIIPKKQSP